jgi:uncharacterized protein with PQ loop repeat
MVHPLHHLHIRKRISQHEPYPSPDAFKRFLDKAIYAVSIIGPALTLPQIYEIWVHQNASGVSTISWAGYLAMAIFWLGYGVIHKEKPIIIAYVLWIILEALVVVGAFLYGGSL